MDEEDKKGFRVTDRRVQSEQPVKSAAAPGPEAKVGSGPEKFSFPEMTFASFLISLNTSALIHLGLLPDPVSGNLDRNPELAKQTIDLLGILQEKTRGNLTKEEQDLFNNLLFELRIKYVDLTKASKEI